MVNDLPSAGSHGGRPLGKLVFLVAIIVGAVVVIVEYWPWRRAPGLEPLSSADPSASIRSEQERIASYKGEASCGECHPGESAMQRRSGHARTLGPAERSPVIAWLNGKSVSDPKYPDIKWSYQVRDKRLVVERTDGGQSESLPLDYGFGSGKHGVTFVAVQAGKAKFDSSGIEHRMSYLADGPRLGLTPGQEGSPRQHHHGAGADRAAFGRVLGPDELRTCFSCHATMISTISTKPAESGTLLPNVSCERCHGPGRHHIEAARRGETDLTMPMGHEPVQPWVEVRLCGECHRLPRSVSSSSISPDNPVIARFQGVGVSMSACYATGVGGLRCTTCHDPHDRASGDHSHYEAVCLSCHRSTAAQKACPVSPATNCVGCHMPRREVRGNGFFTDHWIRKPTPPRPGPAKTGAATTSAIRFRSVDRLRSMNPMEHFRASRFFF